MQTPPTRPLTNHAGRADPQLIGTEWPLVGRGGELEALVATRADVRRRGAVLIGAAGVGKSRLAREALAGAAAGGACVEWVQATASAASVPLGALAGIVPEAARSDDAVTLMQLCIAALRARAGDRPIVLVVDDAQLLDPVSSALVLRLVSTATAFVIATVRAGDPCPDAIGSLWKDEWARRIEVDELDENAVRELVEVALDGPVEHEVTQWLIEVARGNVLYVRELVRGAIESGALSFRDGLWTMVRRAPPSSSLTELVATRLAELDATERETVELLGLGEPLSQDELGELGGGDAVLRLEALGLVTAGSAGARLAHPLYGEVVRGSLPALRGRALRLALVSVFEARRPFGPDDALRVARLLLDADVEPSTELALAAARAANRAGDPALGAQLAELALSHGGGLPAGMLLAQAQRRQGRSADAAATYASIEPLAQGDPAAHDYAHQRLGVLFWELRRPGEAMALVDRIAHWSDDEEWQAYLTRTRRVFGGVAGGLHDVSAIKAIAEDESVHANGRRLAGALHRIGSMIAGDGDAAADDGFAHLPRRPLSDEVDLATLAALVFTAIESGHRLPELGDYLASTFADAIRVRTRDVAGVAALGLGRLHLLRGRYRDAARWLAEADVQLRRGDPFNQLVVVRAAAVICAAQTGDYEATIVAHERLTAWVADHEPVAAQRPSVARANAHVEWLRDPAAAGRRLIADAERFAGEMPGLAPALAYDALRAGHRGAAALTEQLAVRCRARIVTAFAQHAAAHDARDGFALLRVAEEMAELGATRYATEAASEAASVLLADGRGDSARRAAARARELHIEGQGATLPLIDGLEATAVELTPRQRQLIEFARQGLSNAEIADRLVLSVRTVESHLYRGMQKIGVRDRRDL